MPTKTQTLPKFATQAAARIANALSAALFIARGIETDETAQPNVIREMAAIIADEYASY